MLIYGFYKVMVKEIEDILSAGRLEDARWRYADLKRQLGEGVSSLVEARHGLKNLPKAVREMVWYCVWTLLHDEEDLLVGRRNASVSTSARIKSIAARLDLSPETELAFFTETIAPLEAILQSIDIRSRGEERYGEQL